MPTPHHCHVAHALALLALALPWHPGPVFIGLCPFAPEVTNLFLTSKAKFPIMKNWFLHLFVFEFFMQKGLGEINGYWIADKDDQQESKKASFSNLWG